MENAKLNFTGQHIFAGLDISNRTWKTCILTEEYEHKTFSAPPKVETLVKYLKQHFPDAQYHCVYEAGYNGFWIHEELRQAGVDCIVVNPADVPTTHKELSIKTDRIDARKLAHHLRARSLHPIYVPSRSAQEDRSLVRMRANFVRKQTRCKNQIKAILRFYGIPMPEMLHQSYWSRSFLQWLRTLTTNRSTGQMALQFLLDELDHLREQIATMTKQIRLLSTTDRYKNNVTYLTTIPGISHLGAMIILTEIIDIHRFKSLDQLASYVGLAPGEHSTGDKQWIRGITHRHNGDLRMVLIECSWIAVRKDPALLLAFQTLSKRMPKNKAVIRIAHKLLNRIRYVLLHQVSYQIGYIH